MPRQRPVLRAGSLLGLLAALAATVALGGCHLMLSLGPSDSGEDDGAADADGNGEVEGDGDADVDVREDGDATGDAGDVDDVEDAGDLEDEADGGLCGNGVVDRGEECDDGNTDNWDACLDTCMNATCGDGEIWLGVEQCDDGNTDDTDECVTGCLDASCGDGLVQAGVEECDDGNPDNRDGCLDTCVAATCGDGVVRTGVEQCDQGAANSDTAVDACRTSCRWAYCGDGVVDTGEACDDGNTIDTDACRNSCALPGCGDGVVQAGEECDDGNTVNTDACLNTCMDASCGDGYAWTGIEQCDTATPRACASSCGSSGTQACVACSWETTCTAPGEECNGTDDDCDTACDNGFACCAGTSGSCTTGCGSSGTRVCSAICGWSACTPPAEICNGADDDCDTTCDEGFGCCAGAVTPCATGCSSVGTRTCSAACTPGACVAPTETCNGLDDDCDTVCDNGSACCAGATTACTTACGTSGVRVCSSSCVAGTTCCAPSEVCGNGCDDDCDTAVDEGCTSCPPCSGATEITGVGGRLAGTLAAGAGTTTGTCGGSGAEAIFYFTTTATKDVFITSHGSSFDTVLYVRTCTCSGSETACNDDAGGLNTSLINLRDLPAGTYQVFLDAKTAAAGGAYSLDVYITDPGATGDRCGDPLRITNLGASGNSCTFTNDTKPTATDDCTYTGTGGAQDVIYYFVLTAPGSVRFQTCSSSVYCPTPGSCIDTDIYIRRICTQDFTQLICNGDSCGYTYSTYQIQSDTGSVALPAGLYYFVLDGYQEPSGGWPYPCGDYVVTVTGVP
jgi:cysteine-rich repeat protein